MARDTTMNANELLRQIFEQLQKDYYRMNLEQQRFAVEELRRVQSEVSELLASYTDENGNIPRKRYRKIQSELLVIEQNLRERGEIVMEKVIRDSSEFTISEITKRITDELGVEFLTAHAAELVNENVIEYVVKRFYADDLVLSDRIWSTSASIVSEITGVIKSGIIRGESVGKMVANVRKVYQAETWQIRRLVVTEGSTAFRTAAAYSAERSELVDWLQMHRGEADRPDHMCTILSKQDRYGMGAGIFKPTDIEIYNPHPNCTGYVTYVVSEEYTLDGLRNRAKGGR